MFKIKKLVKNLLPNYELYRVYKISLKKQQSPPPKGFNFINLKLDDYSSHALYNVTAKYNNSESYGFGLLIGNKLVAVQWYWFGECSNELDWWPISDDSIMSMHIQVETCYQGRGLSTVLKGLALNELLTAGFHNVYSRVWHNHYASIAMNKRLGATQEGWQGTIGSKSFKLKAL
jgi:hypothetical protein